MQLTSQDRELAAEFKRRVDAASEGHLLEVRAFGSRARGEARIDSDLDLFVLLDVDDRRLYLAICDVAFDIGLERELAFTLEPLIMSRDHFEELVRRERLIALDIMQEGIPI